MRRRASHDGRRGSGDRGASGDAARHDGRRGLSKGAAFEAVEQYVRDVPALLAERADLRRMLAGMYRVAVWAQEFHNYEFFEEFGDMTTLVGDVERTLSDGK